MVTLNLQTSASSDDATQKADTTGYTETTTLATIIDHTGGTGNRWDNGSRWLNATIPPGSTIDSASFQFNVFTTSLDDISIRIYAHKVPNSQTFANNASDDVVQRTPRSTNFVAWAQDSLGTGYVASPEIKTVIQEIINQASWASGNAITLLWITPGTAIKSCYVQTYDSSGSPSAKLDITYTAPSAPVLFNKRVNNLALKSRLQNRAG